MQKIFKYILIGCFAAVLFLPVFSLVLKPAEVSAENPCIGMQDSTVCDYAEGISCVCLNEAPCATAQLCRVARLTGDVGNYECVFVDEVDGMPCRGGGECLSGQCVHDDPTDEPADEPDEPSGGECTGENPPCQVCEWNSNQGACICTQNTGITCDEACNIECTNPGSSGSSVGTSCESDSDCSSGVCARASGTLLDGPKECLCLGSGVYCGNSSDCCEGSCVDGLCASDSSGGDVDPDACEEYCQSQGKEASLCQDTASPESAIETDLSSYYCGNWYEPENIDHCITNVVYTHRHCEDDEYCFCFNVEDTDCTPDCRNRCSWKGCAPLCGDGRLEGNEECDDGNLVNGDGCSSVCLTEACGNNRIDSGEKCDDGNLVNEDGCSDECKIEFICENCGHGIFNTCDETECLALGDCIFHDPWLPGGKCGYKAMVVVEARDVINNYLQAGVTIKASAWIGSTYITKSCVTDTSGACLLELYPDDYSFKVVVDDNFGCTGFDGTICKFQGYDVVPGVSKLEFIVRKNVICSDTDASDEFPLGAGNYYQKGVVTDSSGSYEDKCETDGSLTEHQCKFEYGRGLIKTSSQYDCPEGCAEGMCGGAGAVAPASRVRFQAQTMATGITQMERAGTLIKVSRKIKVAISDMAGSLVDTCIGTNYLGNCVSNAGLSLHTKYSINVTAEGFTCDECPKTFKPADYQNSVTGNIDPVYVGMSLVPDAACSNMSCLPNEKALVRFNVFERIGDDKYGQEGVLLSAFFGNGVEAANCRTTCLYYNDDGSCKTTECSISLCKYCNYKVQVIAPGYYPYIGAFSPESESYNLNFAIPISLRRPQSEECSDCLEDCDDVGDDCKEDCEYDYDYGQEQWDCKDDCDEDEEDCEEDCEMDICQDTAPTPEPVCGDGAINASTEECDDGNLADGDGCSGECLLESAGMRLPPCEQYGDVDLNGYVEQNDFNLILSHLGAPHLYLSAAQWKNADVDGVWGITMSDATLVSLYADGELDTFPVCSSTEPEPVCGDGVINASTEECDDGNLLDEDGCSSECMIEPAPRFSPCGQYGDVDLNGYVEQNDADLIIAYVGGATGTGLSQEQLKNADVDGVPGVTTLDAALISVYAAGGYGTFPVCSEAEEGALFASLNSASPSGTQTYGTMNDVIRFDLAANDVEDIVISSIAVSATGDYDNHSNFIGNLKLFDVTKPSSQIAGLFSLPIDGRVLGLSESSPSFPGGMFTIPAGTIKTFVIKANINSDILNVKVAVEIIKAMPSVGLSAYAPVNGLPVIGSQLIFRTDIDDPRPSPCGQYGDVDLNGYVEQDDADLIIAYVGGATGTGLSQEQLKNANVDGVPGVTTLDAVFVSVYAAGGYDTFPVCSADDCLPEGASLDYLPVDGRGICCDGLVLAEFMPECPADAICTASMKYVCVKEVMSRCSDCGWWCTKNECESLGNCLFEDEILRNSCINLYSAPGLITPEAGGGVSHGPVGMVVPPGAVDVNAKAEISFRANPQDMPSSQGSLVSNGTYDFSVKTLDGEDIHQFNAKITLKITYTASQVAGLDKSRLRIFLFNEATGKWEQLATKVVVNADGSVTLFGETTHLSRAGGGIPMLANVAGGASVPASDSGSGEIGYLDGAFMDWIERVIGRAVNYFFLVGMILAPLVILIGAFMFLTSGGDTNRVAKGKALVIWASIGLAILLFGRVIIAILKYLLDF